MKKYFFLFATLLISKITFAQVPTIKAQGGDGKNIDWAKIKYEENKVKDGPGFFYNDCAHGGNIISASSTLATQGKISYKKENLRDDDPMTAWVEGKTDYGIGEYFEIKSPNVNVIYNGYQSSPSAWLNNSRVKSFKVYFNKKLICILQLTDEMGVQRFELPVEEKIYEDDKDLPIFKFEINEVYKGAKWADVAISHIDYVQCCFAPTSIILGENISIENINSESVIYSINPETGLLKKTNILKTTKQKHVNVYSIKTETKNIDITLDHPLYFKDYGFVSVNYLMAKLKVESVNELYNKVELMIYDEETNTTKYEALKFIEKKEGVFETYSILKLKEGENYIVNGFVSKTY